MAKKERDKASVQDNILKKMAKNPEVVSNMIYQFIDRTFIDTGGTSSADDLKKRAADFITNELKKLIDKDLMTTVLGGENNLNIAVNYKGEEFIIQISAQRESVQHAVDVLNKDSPCQFLAKRSEYQTMTGIDSQILRSIQKSSDTTAAVGVISLVEKLPSSLEKEVKHNKESPSEKTVRLVVSKEIELSMKVGMQLSNIFSTLTAKDIVWTDCKPGNLLIRKMENGDSQLVIADAKGITLASELPVRKSGSLLLDSLITPEFLSQKGQEAIFALAVKNINQDVAKAIPEKTKAIMESEYSYQMAVVLYYTVTGKEVLNSDLEKNKGFDFNSSVFLTNEGQKLKSIIERLSDPDPGKRMHYTDAARLLAVLDNEKAYKAVSGKISTVTPQPVPQLLSTQSKLSLAFAGGQKEAVKSLQRRNSVIDLSKKTEAEPVKSENKENIFAQKPVEIVPSAPAADESHHRPGFKK